MASPSYIEMISALMSIWQQPNIQVAQMIVQNDHIHIQFKKIRGKVEIISL
jgi:REP element-mobilizing transposase RayT